MELSHHKKFLAPIVKLWNTPVCQTWPVPISDMFHANAFMSMLQNVTSMNILTESERSRIWIPRLVFNNTDDEVESILDRKAKVNVVREVSHCSSVITPHIRFRRQSKGTLSVTVVHTWVCECVYSSERNLFSSLFLFITFSSLGLLLLLSNVTCLHSQILNLCHAKGLLKKASIRNCLKNWIMKQ